MSYLLPWSVLEGKKKQYLQIKFLSDIVMTNIITHMHFSFDPKKTLA